MPGYTLSYRDALQCILSSFVLTFIVSASVLSLPVMPTGLRRVGAAVKEYRRYADEMLQQQRTSKPKVGLASNNLMSVLVRASDETKNLSQRLSDTEIIGNIFVFNVAGHDTTANTIAFAIGLMSINPSVQDWLAEEIMTALGDVEKPDYETVYPKLPRVLATMVSLLHSTKRSHHVRN